MIKSLVTTSVKHKKPPVLYTRGWDLAYYIKDFWNEGHEVNGQVEKKNISTCENKIPYDAKNKRNFLEKKLLE